jgi:hypothetical protein
MAEGCAVGLAALGSFLFPTIGRFLLPLVALLLLLLTGEINGSIVLAGTLSLAVTAVAVIGELRRYFKRRTDEKAAELITKWKAERSYPSRTSPPRRSKMPNASCTKWSLCRRPPLCRTTICVVDACRFVIR